MTIRSTQIQRTESGLKVAYAIRDSIISEKPSDAEEMFLLSERIRLCNDVGNVWIAKDLHNQNTGELFDGAGRFWTCGSKLCPFCVKRSAIKNKRNLDAALDAQRLLVGENFRLITLTMPRQKMSLLKCREILNYAFSLFRKRVWFKDTIAGCAKSEEFTVNSSGFNYHIHLLARSKYVAYHKLRTEWTECLRLSFAKYERSISIATADGLAICHSQKITSLSDAVNEVCKYITKSDSWRKLKASDLLDICRIRRFPRMFELLGTFKLPRPQKPNEELGLEAETILDTTTLSDGYNEPESSNDWRTISRKLGASDYLHKLENEINDQFFFRKEQLHFRFPYAKFIRLKKQYDFSLSDAIKFLQKLAKIPDDSTAKNDSEIAYYFDDDGIPRRAS